MNGQTFAEKVLARTSDQTRVNAGEIVIATPDFVYSQDYAVFAIDAFEKMGFESVYDPDRVAICFDHAIPANSARDSNNMKRIREFARTHKINAFYEGGTGIAHQVMVEKGWINPGHLVVASDSHTPSGGSLGALSIGIGESELGFLLGTGKIWLRVPQTIRVELSGKLQPRVYAKDLMLTLIGRMGVIGALYCAVEFTGPAAVHLSVSERFTLCNMTAELGAKTGYFPFDHVSKAFLVGRAQRDALPTYTDDNALLFQNHSIDLTELQPVVALPGREDRTANIADVVGTKIDQVFFGSCTNARIDDLIIGADLLRGRQVHPSIRMLVVPASRAVAAEAAKAGLLQVFLDAGATILPSGCAVCSGTHQGVLADGEKCLSTSNRNGAGRMGNPNAEIILCSPATAVASAIAGEIADPRLLADNLA